MGGGRAARYEAGGGDDGGSPTPPTAAASGGDDFRVVDDGDGDSFACGVHGSESASSMGGGRVARYEAGGGDDGAGSASAAAGTGVGAALSAVVFGEVAAFGCGVEGACGVDAPESGEPFTLLARSTNWRVCATR